MSNCDNNLFYNLSFIVRLLLLTLLLSCSSPRIGSLRVEWTEEPLGVDTKRPRFTWAYEGGYNQSGFEIKVEDLSDGKTWTSGPRRGSQMYFQPEAEIPIKAMKRYRWEIVSTDEKGRCLSAHSFFESGPMTPNDWLGVWISDGKAMDSHAAPVLRKHFRCPEDLQEARLYFSAAAYADISINGKELDIPSLNPAYTFYDKRNLFAAIDVTRFLESGTYNEITAVLGCGFFNVIVPTAVWRFDRASWRGRPRMIAQLLIRHKDGREYIVATDPTWLALAGSGSNPFLSDNIYAGDTFDNRLAITDSLQWKAACRVDAPSPLLEAQYMPLNRSEKTLEGKIRSIGDTLFVCSWNENISGLTSFHVIGRAGTKITVAHGERLDSTGRLTVSHMDEHFRPSPGYAFQTDTYILREGENDIGGRFSYHGFQYAEIHADSPVTVSRAEADFIHTDFCQTGSFKSSDPELDAVRDVVLRSYKSNFMGIPTDCPQREKNGWTADAHISCEIGLLNFDVASSYLKWIDDLCDSQLPDGRIPAIVPTHGWGFGFGPVWDAALFIIPETLYDYTGDLRAVRRVYPACERYLAWLETCLTEEGIITYGLGDWCPWETKTPNDYTSTCYYYLMNRTMARFAALLNHDDTAYSRKAEDVRRIINDRWFDPIRASYSNGSQCALGLALYLDLPPEERKADVASTLSKAVAAAGGHLDYGMIGSKVVLRSLSRYGYVDQAYGLVKADAPSPAAWVRNGYTTSLEQWVIKKDMSLSQNHVFLGDVAAWMTSDLAGIRPDRMAPGFSHVLIEPHFPAGLDKVESSYKSVSGTIAVKWVRRGRHIRLRVKIPGNVTASISAEGLTAEVGPGIHRFVL